MKHTTARVSPPHTQLQDNIARSGPAPHPKTNTSSYLHPDKGKAMDWMSTLVVSMGAMQVSSTPHVAVPRIAIPSHWPTDSRGALCSHHQPLACCQKGKVGLRPGRCDWTDQTTHCSGPGPRVLHAEARQPIPHWRLYVSLSDTHLPMLCFCSQACQALCGGSAEINLPLRMPPCGRIFH